MRALVRIIGGLIVLAIVTLLGLMLMPMHRTAAVTNLAAGYEPPAGAGERVAIAADCAACHTAPGGKPFAGGRVVETPIGRIYASNITPDRKTGIGNYTLDDFRAALYDGLRRDGVHLYPAMPYPSYRKMTEEDVRALYGYFMNELAPVEASVPETRLAFPFNQRWGIRLWDWASLPPAGFRPYMRSAKLDRGAYLVEALAHCGSCHTPRNGLTFAEKGYESRSADFLTGGVIGAWPAPDLRARDSAAQRWSDEQLAALLASGRNETAGVSGEMAVAVDHSLQHLPKSDMEAIVSYLKAIKQDRPIADASAPRSTPAPTAQQLASASPQLGLGARLYLDNCNACHFATGKGAKNVFPNLDGNAVVTAKQPGGLISLILNGDAIPSTSERPERLVMPGFGWRLNDDEVAALATFVRQSWSNAAPAVTTADVAKLRGAVNTTP
ncbi:cytochrome c [Bradyrhizobium huanghuaihaiense]|uniref:cytochrome c n=1 Tax=Bradyrhizobium huanghuaihaiense TaxID=990078 RepID=UPI0021AA65FF|nr:cytochrome c [Bradyrhizobium sp. CB3035]UWU75249.1 cytochrome c [Bradyrhizobium sp. CB3035]